MQVQEILENEELRLEEFPVARTSAYFAHAGVCPLPRRVAVAMSDYVRRATAMDQEEAASLSVIAEAKKTATAK